MNLYYFKNSQGALPVMIAARTSKEAWRKLQRTHAFYFQSEGWSRVTKQH